MTISSCYVWKWLSGSIEPVVASLLEVDPVTNIQSFNYGRSYLERKNREPIYHSELPLEIGKKEPPLGMVNFPSLRDASPDAWGRRVINTRLATDADKAKGDGYRDIVLSEMTNLMNSSSDRIGSLDFQVSSSAYIPRQAEASLDDLYKRLN